MLKSIFTTRTLVLLLAITCNRTVMAQEHDGSQAKTDQANLPADLKDFVDHHCIACHDDSSGNHGVDLLHIAPPSNPASRVTWEKVIRKLSAGQMPPPDADQPSPAILKATIDQVTTIIDQAAAQHLEVGRTSTFRRLTRYEYQNVIRDLFGIQVDTSRFLPADEISHGFDNVTVDELPPSLVQRYVTAAQRISRMVMQSDTGGIDAKTIRTPPDQTQEEHVEGLPLGTRGGIIAEHYFSRSGKYEFAIRLTRDRNEHVEGLRKPHDIELLIDGSLAKSFRVYPPRGGGGEQDDYTKPSHENVDQHLQVTIPVEAGTHRVGVTFIKSPSLLLETKRQPLDVHYNMYRHPRLGPAIFEVSITGPLREATSEGESKATNRNPVLNPWPKDPTENAICAKQLLTGLMEKALRRSLSAEDQQKVMEKYKTAASDGGFEAGIEFAISYLLIHPDFLFRIERDPAEAAPNHAYTISDTELASRLSFFLWSSVPDSTLLQLARERRLHKPSILREQVRRMLKDPKSSAISENFADQWLYLRNIDSLNPDARRYPNFDNNLRQAFKKETQLFFANLIEKKLPLSQLIDADYTFLNERLAKHYGIAGVWGSHFRMVPLETDNRRGGLLRHGSILSVTSYAHRTSPVLRGKWVLENLIGTPPPPPPPDVPVLDENSLVQSASIRERLKQHREAEACATCHRLIDPIGFAMQKYDAIGRWRELDSELPVDSSGALPDGTAVTSMEQLEQGLLKHTDVLAGTLTEKLITYALGRGIEATDATHVRRIIDNTAQDGYPISSLIEEIVLSPLFRMRMPES